MAPAAPRPAAGGRRPALLLVLLLFLAAGLGGWLSRDWPSDNRIDLWLRNQDRAAHERLKELFRGDDLLLVRSDGFRLEDGEALAWLQRAGLRMASWPGVLSVTDPFRLPAQPEFPPRTALEQGLRRPLCEALDLVDLDRPRVDYILRLDGRESPERWLELSRRLRGLAEEAEGLGLRLRSAGHPLVAAALSEASARMERLFTPLLVAVSLLGVALVLGSLRLALLCVLPALTATLVLRAVLDEILHWPSNLILVGSGPLTLVLILAASVHLVSSFRRHSLRLPPPAAARQALRDKGQACLLAALTTAVGFGVFGLSPVEPVRRLGLAVAGVMLLGVPATLAVLTGLLAGLGGRSAGRVHRRSLAWNVLAAGAIRRRWGFLALVLGVLTGASFVPAQLDRGMHPLDYFPEDAALRREYFSIEAEGTGLATLEVMARKPGGGRWTAGDFEACGFEEAVAGVPRVQAVFGPKQIEADMAVLPSVVRRLVEGLVFAASGRLDESRTVARWTVRFFTVDSRSAFETVARVRERIQAWGRERGYEVEIAGTLPLLFDIQERLIGTLAQSLGLTVLATALLFLLVVRRTGELLSCLAANLFPVAVALLALAWFGWPLDSATVMVAAVVLGLAVDNTFHLLHTAHLEERRGLRGVLRAWQRVGEAAAVSSLALCAGFSVLVLSGFVPTQRFGALTAAGALAALVSNLLVLPALLSWTFRRRLSGR